uniref:Uncharacterized protein n=1 Tax=Romanomermis culicivorax TaxID=13658 RepID=A0A915IQ00_ROMCU
MHWKPRQLCYMQPVSDEQDRDIIERNVDADNDTVTYLLAKQELIAQIQRPLFRHLIWTLQQRERRELEGYKMSKDNLGGLKSSGLPRTPPGKKVHDSEKLIVLTSAASLAEEDNGSDHRPLSVKNECDIPKASTAVEREDKDMILGMNNDTV